MRQNIYWHISSISQTDRVKRVGHKPCVVWFTGLSGSGKSSIAHTVEKELFNLGAQTYTLDGDNIRHGLNSDLGFSDKDRKENIRRISEVARLFLDAGHIILTAFISPFTKDRERARKLIGDEHFIEVFVDAPMELCEQRDPKGLYKKQMLEKLQNLQALLQHTKLLYLQSYT